MDPMPVDGHYVSLLHPVLRKFTNRTFLALPALAVGVMGARARGGRGAARAHVRRRGLLAPKRL